VKVSAAAVAAVVQAADGCCTESGCCPATSGQQHQDKRLQSSQLASLQHAAAAQLPAAIQPLPAAALQTQTYCTWQLRRVRLRRSCIWRRQCCQSLQGRTTM
jgi:hypothetical protein